MSTHININYHLIFSTKNREPVLHAENRNHLYRYIWGLLKNENCHLYRIGGIADHIHILTSLHPMCSLSNLVKDIKLSTSAMIKKENLFPGFTHWQNGYGAFTHSQKEIPALIDYIINQEEHHRKVSFMVEYKQFLIEAGVTFKEEYLFE